MTKRTIPLIIPCVTAMRMKNKNFSFLLDIKTPLGLRYEYARAEEIDPRPCPLLASHQLNDGGHKDLDKACEQQ
ncbi:MAG: hypothetical protein IK015_04530 [Treponema sp.]|nr:hypothetical protein [Treponema sp.]